MTEDHQLLVLDEPPVIGREANLTAWQGYATSFPEYVIYPHRIAERHRRVAVLGHTTGSHLGLPDDEEAKLLVIWAAEVRDGALSLWRILDDSPEVRQELERLRDAGHRGDPHHEPAQRRRQRGRHGDGHARRRLGTGDGDARLGSGHRPALPTYWAMQGFRDVIMGGAGVVDVARPGLVMAGFGVLFTALAAAKFRFEDTKVYFG